MAAIRTKGWGGPRRGSGRKSAVPGEIRRNRVAVMLTDTELATLHRLAESRELPLGTVAYELLSKELRRAR